MFKFFIGLIFFSSNIFSEKYFIKEIPLNGIYVDYNPKNKTYQKFLNIFKSSEIRNFFEVNFLKKDRKTEIYLADENSKVLIFYKKFKKNLVPVFGAVKKKERIYFGHANNGKKNLKKFKEISIKEFSKN